jgi:hypothetical protein
MPKRRPLTNSQRLDLRLAPLTKHRAHTWAVACKEKTYSKGVRTALELVTFLLEFERQHGLIALHPEGGTPRKLDIATMGKWPEWRLWAKAQEEIKAAPTDDEAMQRILDQWGDD